MRSNEFHGKDSIRYNGSERICSRLGDRTFSLSGNVAFTPQTQQRLATRIMQVDQDFRAELLELVEAGDVPVEFPNVLNLITLLPANPNANSHSHSNTSNDIFYYHTNHLGSTAFVTDNNATVTQGFLYAPFGEITTEYAPLWQNGVLPKYSFNAKELDEETGMYYYEARYYAPPVFTSRDPLFEQKPWLSPYHYCSNNPVGRVDPSGMLDDEWEYNMGTQTMKWVSATGRDIGVDIVHVKAGNGTEVGSHVCENGLKSCELTGNTTDGYGFHSESLHIQDGYNSADFSYSSYQSDMPTSSSSSYEGNCLGELALGTSIGSTMVDEAAKSSVNLSKAAKEAEALKVFKGVSKVAKGLGALGAFTSVAGAYIDFKNASTAAGQIHAVTNGIMSIVGLLPPWGTAASIAWGMVDIGYGDKIFK